MKKFAMLAAALLFAAAPALAAEKTWTGTIGDAKCGAKHMKAEHGSQQDGDHDCVTKCVAGGQKYVFVAGGKTYQIANQDFAALKDHAGHKVALTGEMKGDSITVSKIDMPPAKPEAKSKK
jgi:opacity protein-like surface antigen